MLELHRGLFARADNEDLTQHVEFAQALYASALAGSPQKAAELKQAGGAHRRSLPPAMRATSDQHPPRCASRIAEAQGVLMHG